MINKFKINFESSLTHIILYSVVVLTSFIISSVIADKIASIYFKNTNEVQKLLDIKNDISPDKIDVKKIEHLMGLMQENNTPSSSIPNNNPFLVQKK